MSYIKLNDQQKVAVKHKEGPMMVIAGPGSGKTTVITCRVLNLIKTHKINPKEILVISFTKSSSEEMKNRFVNLNNGKKLNVAFGTFHSCFYRILRSHYKYDLNNIIFEDEIRRAIKGILINEEIYVEDIEDFISNIILEISLVKSELINIEYYNSINLGAEEFKKIYKQYEQYKITINKIDFDDMLLNAYNLLNNNPEVLKFWQNKYKYILIDEFQDINKVQYKCIKLLSGLEKNLFIVGDDDQSIYKFRGARPEFLLKFPEEFLNTKSITLNINYRSTDEIIKVCNRIISYNKERYDKKIIGTNVSGDTPVIFRSEDMNKEAIKIGEKIKELNKKISYKNIAVVYRTNIQARAFVDSFMNLNIPYQLKDKVPTIYDHWISKDICAYINLSLDRYNNSNLERIINKPSRYISKAIIETSKKNISEDKSLLVALYNASNIAKWQLTKIEELMFYLNGIKTRTTYNAIKYIRQGVGYDKYLKEYADYRKMNSQGLFEVLDELQESSKSFENLEEFLLHVQKVIEETKNSRNYNTDISHEGVTLTTMHSVKGLEYNVVFLASVIDGVIPYEKSKTDSEIEEECRLLYVGLTRAKEKLFISLVKNRHEKKVKPSRFLNDILKI